MARLNRTSLWLSALALAAASLPVSWAIADEFEADSSVSISVGGAGNFKGRVRSDFGRCERGRDVTLFKRRANKPAKNAGSDTTNGAGEYKIVKSNPQGRYFVKVGRKLTTPYGHRHDCKRARSSTINVE